MIDREKVIKGLECCAGQCNYHGCPYKDPCENANGVKQIMLDALALLKEQETDAEIEGGGRDWWYVCGECRAVIDSSDSYCSKCGRRIRWKRLGGDE